jgi:hypothetical protein
MSSVKEGRKPTGIRGFVPIIAIDASKEPTATPSYLSRATAAASVVVVLRQ